MRRVLTMLFLAGAVLSTLSACGNSDSTGTSGTSSSTGSGMSTTSGAGGMTGSSATSGSHMTSSSSAASSSSATSGSGGAGGAAPGHCKKGCAMKADCCPPNTPNCPGAYPNNWTCDNGICGTPQCSVKADCTFGGMLPQYDCVTIKGFHGCVVPCVMNVDCSAPATCIGVDDNMNNYCKIDIPPFKCMSPADCAGVGQCDLKSGECICYSNNDCTDPNANTCAH